MTSSHSSLRFQVVESVSHPGARLNEHGVVIRDSGGWVVDGASGLTDAHLTPGASDAHWLMDRLTAHLGTSTILSPATDLLTAADHVYQEFDGLKVLPRLHQYEYPSASVVGCSFSMGTLQAVRLGDCSLLLQPSSGGDVVKFHRSLLRDLDDAVVAQMTQTQAKERMTGSDAYTSALPHLRKNRSLINEVDGYSALTMGRNRSVVPDTLEVHVTQPSVGLLCSDGFWRLVETFSLYTEHDLLPACQRKGLAALITELRSTEHGDPDGLQFPRLKGSDDATAVLFEVVPS